MGNPKIKPQSLEKINFLLGLVIVLLIAIGVRIPQLNSSFWLDEAAQALESIRPFSQQLLIDHDFQPPLMHILVHLFTLANSSEWWLRLVSLISGLGTIIATFALTKRIANTKVAVLTTLFLTINSFHVFYSQELRPYALTGLFVATGWYLVVRIAEYQTFHPKLLILLVLNSIAGMYSTYLFPFAFLGQLLFLMSRRNTKAIAQALISGLVTTLAFLPWIPFLFGQMKVGRALQQSTPAWQAAVGTPQLKALQLVVGKFVFGVIDLEVDVLFVFTTLIILGLTAFLLHQLHRKIGITTQLIIGGWFVLPIFIIWIFSFFLPIIQPKRVLFALPAFELIFALVIVYGWQWKKTKIAAMVLLILLTASHLFGTFAYYFNPKYQREDWKSIITQIDTNFSASNTIVVFRFDHPFSPWDWYHHQSFSSVATGTATKTSVEQVPDSISAVLDYQNVIVFDYLADLTDPNHTVEQYLTQYNFQAGQLFVDPNIGFVRVYSKGGSFALNTKRHY